MTLLFNSLLTSKRYLRKMKDLFIRPLTLSGTLTISSRISDGFFEKHVEGGLTERKPEGPAMTFVNTGVCTQEVTKQGGPLYHIPGPPIKDCHNGTHQNSQSNESRRSSVQQTSNVSPGG